MATGDRFPFDLFDVSLLDGPIAELLGDLSRLCLHPPYPWGQWLYGRLLRERLSGIEGDLIECGVAKGGMSLFLGRIARNAGRHMYALDSFEGLPEPDPILDNAYFRAGDYRAKAERGDLLARFQQEIASRALGEVITPVRGFFDRTLSTLPGDLKLAFMHLDVDLYRSALDCLEALWPRLSPGGMMVMDDFFHHAQGPARATADFFRAQKITPLYHVSFPYSVVVVKGEAPPPGLHRALDGNRYSLDWLRADPALHRALEGSLARAEDAPRRVRTNAVLLRELLRPEEVDRSGDIYDYQRALEDYWDDMDVETTNAPPLSI